MTPLSRTKGFSLIEISVVMGVSALLGSVVLYEGLSSYTHAMARGDLVLIASAFRRARAESQAGICSAPNCADASAHGVYIDMTSDQHAASLTIFEGYSYNDRTISEDVIVPLSGRTVVRGDTQLTFTPYSATTTSAAIILSTEGMAPSTILINEEGGIYP